MKSSAPILLIIAAVGGFTSGAFIDGELAPHSFRIPMVMGINYFEHFNGPLSLIQSAELSGKNQAIIDHAIIDFKIEQIQDGEYYKNIVSECIFRSEESFGGEIFPDDSIDDGLCIICKLKGECRDVNEGFVNLSHGSKLGAINLELSTNGIYLTVDARNGRPNTAIIFEGNTEGGAIDTASEPDPDLRADGDQADADDLDGICAGCSGLFMVIIPENIDDYDADNLVDIPNDSAAGGTQRYQFELPRRVVSFDFVDMDRPTAAVHEARAYSDFSCTQLIDNPVPIPNGVDGNVQTISMPQPILDAGARCLEIEAHDSFGVTNLVLECPEIYMDGTILGSGRVNLADGYTANEEIHIPIDGIVNVLDRPQHVDIKIESALFNYHGLNHGDVINNQFLGAYGIKVSGAAWVNGDLVERDPVVFNTELTGTSDFDLEVNVGNISIVQENPDGCGNDPNMNIFGTCDDPDDNASGGIQRFQFEPRRYVNSLVWIDADRPEPFGTIFLYSDYDCDPLSIIDQGTANGGINIPFTGDKTTQVLVPVQVEQVGCMIADYSDSGGLSRLNLGCPLPDDPVTVPWFKGEHQGSSTEESIFFTDFENVWEIEEWYLDPSVQNDEIWGHYFDIVSESGDWWAFSGWKVLTGWGSFWDEAAYIRNAIDISGYHSVVVSVQYSYEDTEDADSFFLYYKDGNDWIPIINVPSPQSSSAQFPWTLTEVNIPNDIDSLVLQFKWTTSSGSEHVMIDNLEVFGIPI